jgi:nucleotidyltransferase/DNA polymerase involved in DNA repair
MMFDIVRRYVDDVEEYSIDECFGDLTGLDKPLKMTYKQIAERIKKEISEELNLSVSVGVAPTKVLAKVASKYVKPNGLTIITPETISNFLIKTPIEKIWGIGPRTAETLKQKGVFTAQNFVEKDIEWVKRNLSQPYEVLWQELRGNYLMEIERFQYLLLKLIESLKIYYRLKRLLYSLSTSPNLNTVSNSSRNRSCKFIIISY